MKLDQNMASSLWRGALLFIQQSGRGYGPHALAMFLQGMDLVLMRGTDWVSGLVWTGTQKVIGTGTWSPDHPARSKLLYWLPYPGRLIQ